MESPKTEVNDANEDGHGRPRSEPSRNVVECDQVEPIYGIVNREAHRRTVQFQQLDDEAEPNDANSNHNRDASIRVTSDMGSVSPERNVPVQDSSRLEVATDATPDSSPPSYRPYTHLDLPPAYSDLSGPPFCYGFVNQQRSLLTRHSNNGSGTPIIGGTRGFDPATSGFLTFYDGIPMYFPTGEEYGAAPVQPPTRPSVWTQPRQTTQNGSHVFKFVSWVIVIILWIIVPMAALLIGTTFVEACPVEKNIPTFLIIGGCILMLRGIIYLASSKNATNNCANSVGTFLDIVTIFWIVLGSFWVFSVIDRVQYKYKPLENPSNYCHKIVFTFALWLLVAFYVLFLLAWLFVLICICVYLFDTRSSAQNSVTFVRQPVPRRRSNASAPRSEQRRRIRRTSNHNQSSNRANLQPSSRRAMLNRLLYGSARERRTDSRV